MLQRLPPNVPLPTRLRTQLESFLVLRRNPLELWGGPAYEQDILPGRFLGREQLMINAPEAIRHVLVTNAENYTRTPATRRVLRPVLGTGLFLAEGEAWRHQRRTIAPALAPRTMPILARHVVAASEAKEAELDRLTHRPIELLAHLQHLALAIAGQSMFSLEMSGFAHELRSLLIGYGTRYAQPGVLDLLLPEQVPSLVDRGRAAFRTEWLAFLDRLIEVRRRMGPAGAAPGASPRDGAGAPPRDSASPPPGDLSDAPLRDPPNAPLRDPTGAPLRDSPETRPRDLFDLLSAARDPETGAGFDHAQLRDEVSTMILAGHETTAVTLFWSLYLAALYPDQQEALAAELAGADLSADQAATALGQLPATRAHVDEALRLYPPAFLIVRGAKEADAILGHPVAAGTTITISPWVLHRHRARWHAPDAFDPSRFMPAATPPERYAYMPFGAGPRICVGAQFALTEATLVLGRLLKRFRVSLAGSGTVVPRGVVTTQPDRPVRFVLTPR